MIIVRTPQWTPFFSPSPVVTQSASSTGAVVEPPTVLWGHLRDLHRTDEKILGYPPSPRNVVPANTLDLVAHLVTF